MPLDNLRELHINIILAFLLIAIIIPPTLGDILKRSPMDKRKITGITLNGWFFFPLVILAGYFAYLKEVVSDKDRNNDKIEFRRTLSKNRSSDSTQIFDARQKILDSLGMVGISTSEIKRKLDSLKFSKLPISNPLFELNDAPYFSRSTDKDDYKLNFVLKNFGTGNAKNVHADLFKLRQSNGQLAVLEQLFDNAKSFDLVVAGAGFTSQSTYHMMNFNKNDSIYYFVRVVYQNENNKHLSVLRMIYLMPIPNYDGQMIQEINDNDFKKVKSFLINQKIW